MKKLLVCLLALGTAVLIARYMTEVALLDAEELGSRSAQAVINWLAGHGISMPESPALILTLSWFLRPGAYLVSRVGVDPAGDTGLALAVLFGWWLWLSAARLTWCLIARTFGLYDMAHFRWWLRLGPPWRPVYRLWLLIRRWWNHFFIHRGPSAAWTGFLATLVHVYRRGDCVPLGRPLLWGIRLFQMIGLRGKLHVLVLAAAGAGKTRWATNWMGNLHPKASALVVDCDAQIVNAVGEPLQRQGHKVVNLDPFHLSKFPIKGSWNAVYELDRAVKRHGRKAVVRYAQTIAECAVLDDNDKQQIFANVARQFLHGLILFVWLFEPKEKRNLVRVRELAARGMAELVIDPKQDAFSILLQVMKDSVRYDDECGGAITDVIARAASVMESGQRAREGNPFRTSLLAATAWLDLPEMAAISQTSDFTCEDLKLGNTCVFISAPVMDVQTKLSGWVRILTVTAWYVFANIDKHLRIPSAWIIDEMPSLRIPALDVAAPVARKHGIRLVLIAQDIEKIRQAYPHSYKGFGGNAMATIWLATEHPDNLHDLSETLGTCLRKEKIEGGWFSKVPSRYQLTERKLAHEHQLAQLLDRNRGWIVVTRAGGPPMLLALESPENALPVWSLNPDPDFGEAFPRAFMRQLLDFNSRK